MRNEWYSWERQASIYDKIVQNRYMSLQNIVNVCGQISKIFIHICSIIYSILPAKGRQSKMQPVKNVKCSFNFKIPFNNAVMIMHMIRFQKETRNSRRLS